MKLKLFYFFCFILISDSLIAQKSHEFIEVDNSRIMTKIVLKTSANASKVLVFTSKNQNKSIKFTGYLMDFSEGKLQSKTIVKLSSIDGNKFSEERICVLRKLTSNKFLLVSMSDKRKKNSIVFRVFNENGEIIKEHLFSVNSSNKFYNLSIDDNKFVVCYRGFKSDNLNYIEFDEDLRTLRTTVSTIINEDMLSHGFYASGNYVYTFYSKITKKDTDLTKPQFSINVLDFENSRNKRVYNFINSKFHCKFHFFVNAKSIDVVCYDLTKLGKFSSGVVCKIVIDKITLNEDYTRTSINLNDFGGMLVFRHSRYPTVMDLSFKVTKNVKGEYMISVRTGKEHSTTTIKSDGKMVQEYSTTFGSSVILIADSTLNHVISNTILNNSMSILSSYNSHLFDLHHPSLDVCMPLIKSDTSKYFLSYMVKDVKENRGLNVKVIDSRKFNYDSSYSIFHNGKSVSEFYFASLEEMSPGVFILKVSFWGSPDKLLIIRNKED